MVPGAGIEPARPCEREILRKLYPLKTPILLTYKAIYYFVLHFAQRINIAQNQYRRQRYYITYRQKYRQKYLAVTLVIIQLC